MTLAFGPVLLAWLAWHGAPPVALGLIAAGWLVHVRTALRLVQAHLGGAGGHAEWVRASSVRPRIRRSPAWWCGWGLMAAGAALAVLA
jgi:hypothetical protein